MAEGGKQPPPASRRSIPHRRTTQEATPIGRPRPSRPRPHITSLIGVLVRQSAAGREPTLEGNPRGPAHHETTPLLRPHPPYIRPHWRESASIKLLGGSIVRRSRPVVRAPAGCKRVGAPAGLRIVPRLEGLQHPPGSGSEESAWQHPGTFRRLGSGLELQLLQVGLVSCAWLGRAGLGLGIPQTHKFLRGAVGSASGNRGVQNQRVEEPGTPGARLHPSPRLQRPGMGCAQVICLETLGERLGFGPAARTERQDPRKSKSGWSCGLGSSWGQGAVGPLWASSSECPPLWPGCKVCAFAGSGRAASLGPLGPAGAEGKGLTP